jgi:hypothetical protein
MDTVIDTLTAAVAQLGLRPPTVPTTETTTATGSANGVPPTPTTDTADPLTAAWPSLYALMGETADLSAYRPGLPQRVGALTVVPVFGPERTGFAPPSEGIRLGQVHTYGDATLTNPSRNLSIVPLHLGFIQHGAQNHAFCRSAFLKPGQSVRFTDACCVQAAQGGYLQGQEQWFFLLPLGLRGTALSLRGRNGYSKLWDAIADLNREYGLAGRGHLEQILTRLRANLTRFQSQFEREEGQVGALFFLHGRLVGVEIAPSAAYFRDVWMPLVCFAYGVPAYFAEQRGQSPAVETGPFADVSDLAGLRAALTESRAQRDTETAEWLRSSAREAGRMERRHEERHGSLQLVTHTGNRFAGQTVTDGTTLVYASLFAVDAAISKKEK